jgi:pyruvate formate lyase activating enzyme
MKKETILYETLDKDKVRCGVCQRKCVIPLSHTGWCRTRINQGGRLYSLIYGEVSSLIHQPIEKPVFHFYPGSRWLSIGSVGCNFRCPGCQNWDIAHWKQGEMDTEYISPSELISRAKASGCAGISWTFNEPALWLEYTIDSARLAREEGLYTNYVTNGFISEDAFDLIAPFLDIYRVDVKAFSEEAYMRTGHIKDFRGILLITEKAKKYGLHVEVVTNVTPGFNDSEPELGDRVMDKNVSVRIHRGMARFYPHLELSHHVGNMIAALEKKGTIGG